MRLEKDILCSLYSSKDTWDKYSSVLEEDFFISSINRKVFLILKEYWEDIYSGDVENKLDSLLELASRTVDSDSLKKDVLRFINSLSTREVSQDSEPIFKRALVIWKVRNLTIELAESLSKDSLDLPYLMDQLENIHKVQEEVSEEVFTPASCIEAILEDEFSGAKFPSGLKMLDEQLDGGLWSGELALLLGPSFRGKTWALIHLGAAALLKKIPVIHFTLEISQYRVAIRYFQNLLEKTRDDIKNSGPTVRREIDELSLPPWVIRDYSSTVVSTKNIERDVKKFIDAFDVTPLIVIDYADLVHPVSKEGIGNEYVSLGKVVEELRRISNKFDTAIWTASQTNRASYEKRLIDMSEVSDSIRKIMTADVIVTLNQLPEEHTNMLMRWYLNKAREREITEKEIPLRALAPIQKFKNLFEDDE